MPLLSLSRNSGNDRAELYSPLKNSSSVSVIPGVAYLAKMKPPTFLSRREYGY